MRANEVTPEDYDLDSRKKIVPEEVIAGEAYLYRIEGLPLSYQGIIVVHDKINAVDGNTAFSATLKTGDENQKMEKSIMDSEGWILHHDETNALTPGAYLLSLRLAVDVALNYINKYV